MIEPDSLVLSGEDFLDALDEGLNESILLGFIENHSPYKHFGKCSLCDEIADFYDDKELDFGFVVSLIAASSSATPKVQKAALNSALGQSEADATEEVVFALVQNPGCSAESLQSCAEVNNSLQVLKMIFKHPNVSQKTREMILDEVDESLLS